MAGNDLALCVAESSVAMILAVWNKSNTMQDSNYLSHISVD